MIATIDRPSIEKEVVRDLETPSLTPEENLIVPGLIEGARLGTNQQFINIGKLYLLLIAGGEKLWNGLTFKDICKENNYFDKSATSCYELGQAYQGRIWAIAQFESGMLSYDPEGLSATCFQALRRLEIEDRSASDIEQSKIDVLEEAWSIAEKRAKKKSASKIRVQETDIHDAIAVLEEGSEEKTIARPRRKKGQPASGGLNSREAQELQAQYQKQGELLRQEREQRLRLQERLDQEVEAEVEAKVQLRLAQVEQKLREEVRSRQQIIAERNTLVEENQALKEQLVRLQQLQESQFKPLLEMAKKNSTTPEENRTNQLTSPIIEVVPPDQEEEIAALVEKKQKQGFDIQFLDDGLLLVEGVAVRADKLILENLTPLDHSIVESLAFVRQEAGESGIFKSKRTYYWKFPNTSLGWGDINGLSKAILEALGMEEQEYLKAIAEFKVAVG